MCFNKIGTLAADNNRSKELKQHFISCMNVRIWITDDQN